MGLIVASQHTQPLIFGAGGTLRIEGPRGEAWWMAAGITPWAAYQPKGATSFAASLVDLTGQGHDAIDPGGANTPGWNATDGWTLNGTTQYLATTFVPDNDQSQGVFVQFTGLVVSSDWLFGTNDGAGKRFRVQTTATGIVYQNGGTVTIAVAPPTAGNVGVAGNSGYRNGVAEGAIGAWTGTATLVLRIGVDNPATGYTQASYQAFIIYDVAPTAPQAALIATAMAAI